MLQCSARFLSLILLAIAVPAGAATWLETTTEIQQLAEASNFEAAVALGPDLLETARETFGVDSQQLVDSHILLARVHRAAGNFFLAEQEILEAIGIVSERNGDESTALIDPLAELGETYFQAGDYELAIAAFEQARSAGRQETGVLSPHQIPILERMSQAAEALGDYQLAKDYQETMFSVASRHYGPASREHIDAAYRYSAWLAERNDFPEARAMFMGNQRIIDEHFDGDPRMTIERLLFAYRHVPRMAPGSPPPTELYEALELVESFAVPDPELHANILLDIGDWSLGEGRASALDRYRETWALLGTFEGGEALRRAWFEDLVVVWAEPIESRYLSVDPSAPAGFVSFAFEVDTHGWPKDVRITSADPVELLDRAAIRQFRNWMFRPQIESGEFVEKENTYTWRFNYEVD